MKVFAVTILSRHKEDLPQIGKDEPVRCVIGEESGQDHDEDDDDEPERPPVSDKAAVAPAFCQLDSTDHGSDINDDVQPHQFVADKDPIGEESCYDHRHDGQSSQKRSTDLLDIAMTQA